MSALGNIVAFLEPRADLIIKVIVNGIILSTASFFLLAFGPSSIFLEYHPKSVTRLPCPPFEGPLMVNEKLTDFKKVLQNEVEGPESFTVYKDVMCTGLANGEIICMRNEKIFFSTQIGNPSCEGQWEEEICGRPLGMRFNKNGTLFVADAYYGLYKINITDGSKTALYTSDTEVDGRRSLLINHLVISKKGDIYFTDSAKWPLKVMVYAIMEANPRGRILHFNPRTNETKVLVTGINFANGIELSPDEKFLVVSETVRNRVLRYYLQGPNKGNMEVFADNLPGFPDNIRLNPRGNYWIGLCGSRTPDHIPFLRLLNGLTIIRKVVMRGFHLFQSSIEFADRFFPIPTFIKHINYLAGHMRTYAILGSPNHGIIVELNQNGEIIQSLHDPTGGIRFISEVEEHNGTLYFGSPWHRYLGKLKIDLSQTPNAM